MGEPCSDHSLVQRLAEWKEAHKDIHSLEEQSRNVLRLAMEHRLEGMNEFRQSLSDSQKANVSREVFDLAEIRFQQVVAAMNLRIANLERLLPIVALLSAAFAATAAGILVKTIGG